MSGKVVVGGHPAEGVRVIFQPTGPAPADGRVVPRTMATTDAEGVFRLSTFGTHDGAPPGEYAVLLVWPERPFDEDFGADRWKGKFGNPKAPVRTVTVAADETGTDIGPIEVNP